MAQKIAKYSDAVLILIILITGFSLLQIKDYIFDGLRENEWNRIWQIRNIAEIDAKKNNKESINELKSLISSNYSSLDKLEEDLKTLHIGNDLNLLMFESIKDKQIYPSLSDRNANDQNFMTQTNVVVDDSTDCMKGEIRDFKTERSIQWNKNLFDNFINIMVNDNNSALRAWQFTPYEFNNNKWEVPWGEDIYNLKTIDEEILKELFFKYKTIRVIERIEFIHTTKIDPNCDLLGNRYSTANGLINLNSYPVYLNQGYNLYQILDEVYYETKSIDRSIEDISRYDFILTWVIVIFTSIFALKLERTHNQKHIFKK